MPIGAYYPRLHSLEHGGDALADADAHGGQFQMCIAGAHGVNEGRRDASVD
jgi:hypothetical protein